MPIKNLKERMAAIHRSLGMEVEEPLPEMKHRAVVQNWNYTPNPKQCKRLQLLELADYHGVFISPIRLTDDVAYCATCNYSLKSLVEHWDKLNKLLLSKSKQERGAGKVTGISLCITCYSG